MRPVLALLLAAALALLAAPAQAVAPVSCQVVVGDWYEYVHCGAGTTYVHSSEDWCPFTNDPDIRCEYFPILTCTGSLLFPCTIL